MMKRIYLKSMTGLVLAGAVTGSLMLSATDLAAFTGPGRDYDSDTFNDDRGPEGRNQWDVDTGYVISTPGTKSVTDALQDSYAFCARIERQEYLADCIGDQLEEVATAIPDWGDYAEAKDILLETSSKLRRLARTNASPSRPPIRAQGTVKGKQIRTGPLTPVREDRVETVKQQAAAILEEAETKLLRSAQASDRRLIAYAQMAKAVGSNKTLLRSA